VEENASKFVCRCCDRLWPAKLSGDTAEEFA